MKAYCSCPRPKGYVCPVDCEKREAYKIIGSKVILLEVV